jgi:hypothetical protein
MGCGKCHECGTQLEDRSPEPGEWCRKCCKVRYYRAHGFAGGDLESCPKED